MSKDTQARSWQLTINNPTEKELSHENIRLLLLQFKSLVYYCMSDEIGLNEETPHTHIYLAAFSPIRFSTMKKRFPQAHIENARGSAEENRAYVFKEGKWSDDAKGETKIPNTQGEWGEMPTGQTAAASDTEQLYNLIKDGKTSFEIIENNPKNLFKLQDIERARQVVLAKQYSEGFRKRTVVYVYGEAGSERTRYVLEKMRYANTYRVTDYKNPFDGYKQQDVLVFDEYYASLPIRTLINYLDGFQIELPCRYNNKMATYSKVFILSDISLDKQYKGLPEYQPRLWNSLLEIIDYLLIIEPDKQTHVFKNKGDFVEIDIAEFEERITEMEGEG